MIIHGDAIEELQKFQANTIDTCFTSPNPPLFTSKVDYSIVGGETTTVEYITHLLVIFEQVKRVLKNTGSLYVQLGDYHDTSSGSLMLVPEQFAITMVNNGWILRDNMAWHRTERIREDAYDKTRHRRDVEYLFRFVKDAKSASFYIQGHSYWRTSVHSYPYNFKPGIFNSGLPLELIDMAIRESCPKNGIILDPMAGTGTVGEVAKRNNRAYILIDTNIEMIKGMKERLSKENKI